MKTKMLILTALFAALTAVGAFIKIPFLYSAITLQFFFTALAGVLLGAKYGALSQLVYVALGLLGLPIFTSGGGFGYFLYPTCGFLIGLIPAAWVIGKLTAGSRSLWRILLASLAGLAVLYLVGLPYMAFILNVYMGKGLSTWAVFMAGMIPFLPGDMVKILVVGVLSPKLLPHVKTQAAATENPS
jgi:biotin transport system substrate-specific component